MKNIIIGTINPAKIAAIQKAIDEYPIFAGANLSSCEVSSGVPDMPMSLEEIILGAKKRAKGSYDSGVFDFGFGLETGLFEVPHTKADYISTTCCAIFDGGDFHLGFSSCFEYPPKMIERILRGEEINEIALDMGFCENNQLGKGIGMVGYLSRGKILRSELTYQSIQMAMLQVENLAHFST